MPWPLAVAIAAAVAAAAWGLRALRPSGAVAATAVGALVLAGTGWTGGAILLAFFLPSSAVSRLWPARAAAGDAKDDRRDAWQVLANGGAPALAAALLPGSAALAALAAGLAAASGDTWATALGAHSATPPRDLLRRTVVRPGTSGGVTPPGSLGAAVGSAVVAAAAWPALEWRGAALAWGIGWAGMWLDSALGAGLQARFHCDGCAADTERRVHRCGARARHTRGWAWLDNDAVNGVTTLAAAVAGWALACA